MTLVEHLEELRSRVFKAAVAFVTAVVAAAFFVEEIFRWLLAPSGLDGLAFLGPAQGILTDVKLVLYVAFVLTVPVLLYQAWMFVVPTVGTLGRIKTYVLVSLASSLFLAGIAFGYYLMLPIGLEFLLGYAPDRYEEVTNGRHLPAVRHPLPLGLRHRLRAAGGSPGGRG